MPSPNEGPAAPLIAFDGFQTTSLDNSQSIPQNSLDINSLPTEILSMIFLTCRLGTNPMQRFGRPPAEITISHVSRLWRDIAKSTPSMWSTIVVDARPCKQQIELYLRRSASSPLDIYLLLVPKYEDLLDILIPHAFRWRRLFILSTSPSSAPSAANSLPFRFRNLSVPVLQVLSTGPYVIWGTNQTHPIFTGGAPALSFLRMANMGPICPLSAVTTLHLDGHSMYLSRTMFGELIAAAHSLTHLSVHGIAPCHTGPNVDPILLPTLRSLRLCRDDTDCIVNNVLRTIRAPHLESMVLKGLINRDFSGGNPSGLSPWGSFPMLQSLTLQNFQLSEPLGMRKLAHALPTVSHLLLLESSDLACLGLIHIMVHHPDLRYPDPQILWPQLHTIEIQSEFTPPSQQYVDILRRILRTRKGNIKLELWDGEQEIWPPGLDFVDYFDQFKVA